MSILSLSELKRFDTRAPSRGDNRRFLCPGCGDSKPKDAAHRSLCANIETGLWVCKRCGERGKLTEYWTCRTCNGRGDFVEGVWRCSSCTGRKLTRRELQARQVYEAFNGKGADLTEIDAKKELAGNSLKNELWRRWWQATGPLAGTPGARYLASRSIPSELAEAAGARFSPNWYAWHATIKPGGAVCFPIKGKAGELVAVHARLTDGRKFDKLTAGEKSRGVFSTPGAFTAPALVICEAPIDALALAVAGLPAIALCGTSWPEWLPQACGLKNVLLAFDADDGGDKAAEKLGVELSPLGAYAYRLRPKAAKDWAEVLEKNGALALAKALCGFSANPLATVPPELENVAGLTADDVRIHEAERLAKAGRRDAAAFITRLLPLEWRFGTERFIGVL